MNLFSLDISLFSIIAIAIAIIAAALALGPGLAPQRRVGREASSLPSSESTDEAITEETEVPESEETKTSSPEEATEIAGQPTRDCPKASVIAYTPEDGELLDEFIEMVCAQDYPDFELILVLDAGAETRAMFVEKYASIPNIYLTFVPPGSQNLSRRKLAITLGMKAAKGDVAVITTSICHIPCARWLSGIMAPFEESKFTEVVLGYCHPDSEGATGLKGRYRNWYSGITSMQWIGYALSGHPYRGDGFNIAFRRSLFFDHKGYARTINLHNGDDDLFVSEISNASNTKMVLLPSTRLTAMWGTLASKRWIDNRERYDFTSRWLPRGAFRRAGMLSLMQWVFIAGATACALFSAPNLIPAIFSLIAIVLFFTAEIIVYRKACSVTASRRLWFTIPLFMLWKPIGNFIFRWRHRRERIKNFTWRRHHSYYEH